MKSINKYINESKTRFEDIENYGTSWISEWGPEYCGNILKSVIKGIQSGIKKYSSDDTEFNKLCEDSINKIIDEINNIY